jgi:hypothetical protein
VYHIAFHNQKGRNILLVLRGKMTCILGRGTLWVLLGPVFRRKVASIYCHVLLMGIVTNNSTWIRAGYRIYSLKRFTIRDGYNYRDHYSTVSFSNPTNGTALRRGIDRFCFRRLIEPL